MNKIVNVLNQKIKTNPKKKISFNPKTQTADLMKSCIALTVVLFTAGLAILLAILKNHCLWNPLYETERKQSV